MRAAQSFWRASQWMATSENGREEAATTNNHSVAYHLQVPSSAAERMVNAVCLNVRCNCTFANAVSLIIPPACLHRPQLAVFSAFAGEDARESGASANLTVRCRVCILYMSYLRGKHRRRGGGVPAAVQGGVCARSDGIGRLVSSGTEAHQAVRCGIFSTDHAGVVFLRVILFSECLPLLVPQATRFFNWTTWLSSATVS